MPWPEIKVACLLSLGKDVGNVVNPFLVIIHSVQKLACCLKKILTVSDLVFHFEILSF
jgi:hypothetical protein